MGDDEQQVKQQRSNPFGAAANATRPHCEAVPASWKEKWVNSRQQQRLDEQKKEQQAFEEEERSEQNAKQRELEEKMRKEGEDKERQTHEDKILKKEATA